MTWFLSGFLIFLFVVFLFVVFGFLFAKNKTSKKINTESVVKNKLESRIGKFVVYTIAFICLSVVMYMLHKTGSPRETASALAPYIFAPLVGLLSYFCSDRGYKKMSYSVVVSIMTALGIFLWLNPWLLKDATTPFVGSEIVEKISKEGWSKVIAFFVLIDFFAILKGYFFEAVFLGVGFLLILLAF